MSLKVVDEIPEITSLEILNVTLIKPQTTCCDGEIREMRIKQTIGVRIAFWQLFYVDFNVSRGAHF